MLSISILNSSSKWVPILSDLITWLLVILGWMVVSDQQVNRERAKNAESRFSALREVLRDIEKRAIHFHTSAYSKNDSQGLLRSVNQLTREASYLHKHRLIGLGTSQDSGEIRKVITYRNFDKSQHKTLSISDALVQGIEAACNDLDRQLVESSFNITNTPRRLRDSLKSLVKMI